MPPVAHATACRGARAAMAGSWVTTTTVVPSRVDAVEQRRDLLARRLVQLAGGLVGQQQARPVGQRARDRHALHLAARELRRPVVRRDGRGRRTRAAPPCARRRSARGTPGLRLRQLDVLPARVSMGSRKKRWNTKPIRRRRSALRSASARAPPRRGPRRAACRSVGVVHAARACAGAWTCRSRRGRRSPRSRRPRCQGHVAQRDHRARGHREHLGDAARLDERRSGHVTDLAAQRGRDRAGGPPGASG